MQKIRVCADSLPVVTGLPSASQDDGKGSRTRDTPSS